MCGNFEFRACTWVAITVIRPRPNLNNSSRERAVYYIIVFSRVFIIFLVFISASISRVQKMKTAAAVAAAEEVNYNIIPPSDAAKTAVRPQPPAEDFIVRIRDAVKTYDGKHAVLNGINVSMRKGEM